jgi:hypothetical protein
VAEIRNHIRKDLRKSGLIRINIPNRIEKIIPDPITIMLRLSEMAIKQVMKTAMIVMMIFCADSLIY